MSFNFVKATQLLIIFLLIQLSLPGQSNRDDSLLINREKMKWEALKTKNFGAHADWFAKDFAAIGYLPDGIVYRTGFGDRRPFLKMDELPTAIFNVSGFKIVSASPEVKVISYQADGPLNLYVSTMWAKRSNEWKTVFYQATKYK